MKSIVARGKEEEDHSEQKRQRNYWRPVIITRMPDPTTCVAIHLHFFGDFNFLEVLHAPDL